jgi:hypothetical protein
MLEEAKRRAGEVWDRLNFRGKKKDELEQEPIFTFEGDGSAQNPYIVTVDQLIETAEKAGWRTRKGHVGISTLSVWLGEAMRAAVTIHAYEDSQPIYLQLRCKVSGLYEQPSLVLYPVWQNLRSDLGSMLTQMNLEFQCNFSISSNLNTAEVQDLTILINGKPHTKVDIHSEYGVPPSSPFEEAIRRSRGMFEDVIGIAHEYARDKKIPAVAEYERGRADDPFIYKNATYETGFFQQVYNRKAELFEKKEAEKSIADWLDSAVAGNLPETYLKLKIRKARVEQDKVVNPSEDKSWIPGFTFIDRAIYRIFEGKLREYPWPGRLTELKVMCRAKTVEVKKTEKAAFIPIQIEILFSAEPTVVRDMQYEHGEFWNPKFDGTKREAEFAEFLEFFEDIEVDLSNFVSNLVEPERKRLKKQGVGILYPKVVKPEAVNK